jgi:hypothetical protein
MQCLKMYLRNLKRLQPKSPHRLRKLHQRKSQHPIHKQPMMLKHRLMPKPPQTPKLKLTPMLKLLQTRRHKPMQMPKRRHRLTPMPKRLQTRKLRPMLMHKRSNSQSAQMKIRAQIITKNITMKDGVHALCAPCSPRRSNAN